MNQTRPYKKYNHGLFIPVHRYLPEPVLNSAIGEARIAKFDFGIDLPIVIIDDAKKSVISECNSALIKKHQNSSADVDILWVNKPLQKKIVHLLSNNLDLTPHLLESSHVNYGVIFNMLFIIGKILGITIYHRRDSDVTTQILNNKIYAPISVELENIKTKKSGVELNIVGGNYLNAIGTASDSNIRLDDCMKNERFILTFLNCIPSEDIEVVTELQRLLTSLTLPSPITTDYHTYPTVNKSSGYVDCGNVCFTDNIYKLIPSAPNDFLIGADYHFFNIARILGFGFYSHKCSVLHDKINLNTDKADNLAYWRNMFNFCDAEAIHFKAYALFKESCEKEQLLPSSPAQDIRQAFIDALTTAKEKITKQQRLDRLGQLSEALFTTGNPAYREIAQDTGQNEFEHILKKGTNDLDNYICLLSRWQDIVDYLPELANRISK